MTRMRYRLTLLILGFTVAAVAQTPPPCTDPDTQNCTVREALDIYLAHARAANDQKAATDEKKVERNVVTANRATTPPPTFAKQFHNTYDDFLNLFSFAINKVEESDKGEAVTVRFNPVRSGEHLIGASLTVAQPTVSDIVKSVIPEDQRDAAASQLEKTMNDTDDLTWAVAWSPSTAECEIDRSASQRCWGRTPSAYRDLLSLVLTPLIPNSLSLPQENIDEILRLTGADDLKSAHLDDGNHGVQVRKLIKDFVAAELATRTSNVFASHHLDLLADLLDNQPQMSVNLTYHEVPHLSGPSDHGLSIELHSGRDNINSLRKACRRNTGNNLAPCLQQQLNTLASGDTLSTDKYVLTIAYKNTHGFQLDTLPVTPAFSFEPLDIPSVSEWHLKGQAGRQMGTGIMGKPMRGDFAVEAVHASRGSFTTANRFVATLTMSFPAGDMITVPVTIQYANKPDLFSDSTKRIGMHFGLSYRLPELFGSK
jgi:hypothetical protein